MGIVLLVLVVLIVGFLYFPRSGSVASAANAATVAVVRGDVDLMHAGGAFVPALDGQVVSDGDIVRANTQGLAVLTFFEGSTLTVEPGSQVTVTNLSRVGADGINVTIEQTIGRTWASVQKLAPGSQFQIKTPTSTAAVRGTAFETVVAVVNGVVTTTVKGNEGAVLVTANAGGSVSVTPGTQVDVPQNAPAPNGPSQQPPTPTLRFTPGAAGVGYTVTDPRGFNCGGAIRQIPGCTTDRGTVTIVDPPSGQYAVTLSAAGAANGALVTAGGSTLSGTLAVGDLARSTLPVTISGPLASAGPFTPLVKLASLCGAESAGRIFSGGTASETMNAAQTFGTANHGQTVAVVLTADQLTTMASNSVASVSGPVTVNDVRVSIDGSGIRASANAAAGPLPVTATARLTAGARDGELLLRIAELNAGILPDAAVSQISSQIQTRLDALAVSFPLSAQRVSFKLGCLAIFGTTR